jgi:hypothetical protein
VGISQAFIYSSLSLALELHLKVRLGERTAEDPFKGIEGWAGFLSPASLPPTLPLRFTYPQISAGVRLYSRRQSLHRSSLVHWWVAPATFVFLCETKADAAPCLSHN